MRYRLLYSTTSGGLEEAIAELQNELWIKLIGGPFFAEEAYHQALWASTEEREKFEGFV